MGFLSARNAATLPPTERATYTEPTACDSGRDICAGAEGNREDKRILCQSSVTMSSCGNASTSCLGAFRDPALDFGAEEGIPELKENWRWEDQQAAVLCTCSSLIVVNNDRFGRPVVQFSHFSVKEFLTSDRLATSNTDISCFHILPEPAHTVIVRACLGILLRSEDGFGDAKAE